MRLARSAADLRARCPQTSDVWASKKLSATVVGSGLHMSPIKKIESQQPSGERRQMDHSHLGEKERNRSAWVQKYRHKRTAWNEERSAERHLISVAQNAGAPVLAGGGRSIRDTNKVLPPITSEVVMPSEDWARVRSHNKMCEVTGLPATPGARKECAYCPIVVRLDAFRTLPRKKHISKRWVCPECQLDIQNNRQEAMQERQQQQDLIDQEKGAILLQAHVRSFRIKRNFDKSRRGATILESRFRGLKARQALQSKFSAKKRPFKILVVSASGLRVVVRADRLHTYFVSCKIAPQFMCMAVSKAADTNGKSDPLVHVAVVDGHNSEKQLFHFQTKTKKGTLQPHFSEVFLVPGADGNVTLVFTLIDWDALRNDFLGQAVLKLRGTDTWQHGGRFELPLQELRIAPKESDRTSMRLGERDAAGMGRVKVEILPLSNLDSFCGFLEDKSGNAAVSGRRHWAVLADGQLFLYRSPKLANRFHFPPYINLLYLRYFGDTKVRMTIILTPGTIVRRHIVRVTKKGQKILVYLIDISTLDRDYTFAVTPLTGSGDVPSREWECKIRYAIQNQARRSSALKKK